MLRAENRSRTTARYTHPATPAHTSSLTHVGFWRLTVNRCRSRLESGPAGLQADHRRERVAEERPPPLLANQPRAAMSAAGRAGLPQLEMRTCRTLDALPGDERRAHQSQQADAPHTATVLCRGAAEHIIGRPFNVRTGTACDPWSRKLPRQVDSREGDCSPDEGLGRNVSGGTRPRLSWGRTRL